MIYLIFIISCQLRIYYEGFFVLFIFIFIRYNSLVFEALSTIKDPNGSDLNAIISFIEVRWLSWGYFFLYLTTYDHYLVDKLNDFVLRSCNINFINWIVLKDLRLNCGCPIRFYDSEMLDLHSTIDYWTALSVWWLCCLYFTFKTSKVFSFWWKGTLKYSLTFV